MTTTDASTVTASTDLDRLHQMRDVAERLIREAGVPPSHVIIDAVPGRRLEIGVWPRPVSVTRNWNNVSWGISIEAPSTFQGTREPAIFRVNGKVTPAFLSVITAIDALFWEDRER